MKRVSRSWSGSHQTGLFLLASLLAVLLLSPATTVVSAASTAHCSSETEFYCVPGGRDYRGTLNTTSGGSTCQAWSSQTPWPHSETYPDVTAGIGDHNYCRYMEALQTVGCYTTDPQVQVDTCDIGDPCECRFPDKTITFTPPSGSLLVADGSTNFVTLQCFPSPCDLYYTINGDTPALGNGIPYNGLGIMLTNSTLLKALAVYADGTLNRFATYAVDPLYTPDPSIKFAPATDVVYSGPVLAHIEGLATTDDVLLFIGDAAPIAYAIGDSFWVSNTSEVTAVINGQRTVSATYVIQSTAPTFAVYPVSGSFLGGIIVVIYAESARELYASVNGAPETKLDNSALRISTVGLNVVTIRAVYLGGVASQSVHRYEVVEATVPTISPTAALFHRSVNVTCQDPLGRALTVRSPSVSTTENDSDDDDEVAYALQLTKPGVYTVNCTYTDNLYNAHSSQHVITLTAVPLPVPTPAPACGTDFPFTPLFLHAAVRPATDNLTAADTAYTLSIRADTTAGRVQFVEQLDATTFAYALVPAIQSGSVPLLLQSASSDVMEASSDELACSYAIHPLGDRRTPLHVARPVCPTFEDTAGGVVPTECQEEIAFQLASCLNFYTTELLDLHVYGPLLAIRVNQLPSELEMPLYARIHTCLAGSAGTPASVDVTDVQGEVDDAIQLATGWRLIDGISVTVVDEANTAPLQQTISDASFLIRITGMHTSDGAYYFVPEAHTCFDLGSAASSNALQEDGYTDNDAYTSSVDTSGAILVVFSLDVAGSYKLCARFGTAVYEVESFSPLTVTTRPWPTIAPVRADACGGLVDTAYASAPLTVSFDAGPASLAPLLTDYWHAIDGSATWLSTALGGAVSLSPVESYASPSHVVVASLGALSGAQDACVFYAPAVKPAVNRSGITYRFYSVPLENTPDDAAAAASARDLVVLLTGTFQTTELMTLTLRSPIWAVPFSTNVSDAVWVLRGETRMTTSPAVNLTLAVPHKMIRVESSVVADVWRVTAVLDGVEVTLSPSKVALSDLAAGMVNTTHCTSGYGYGDKCVCIGTQNKTAYICGNATATEPEVPATSSSERIVVLVIYLILIAAIAAYIGFSIVRGERQHVQDAEDLTIEPASPSPVASPVVPAPTAEARNSDSAVQRPREGEAADDVTIETDVDPENPDRGAGAKPANTSGAEEVEVNASNWF